MNPEGGNTPLPFFSSDDATSSVSHDMRYPSRGAEDTASYGTQLPLVQCTRLAHDSDPLTSRDIFPTNGRLRRGAPIRVQHAIDASVSTLQKPVLKNPIHRYSIKWKLSEEETLKVLHEQLGANWNLYTAYFPGRSANAIKRRYHALVTRALARHDNMVFSQRSVQLQVRQEVATQNLAPTGSFQVDTANSTPSLLRCSFDEPVTEELDTDPKASLGFSLRANISAPQMLCGFSPAGQPFGAAQVHQPMPLVPYLTVFDESPCFVPHQCSTGQLQCASRQQDIFGELSHVGCGNQASNRECNAYTSLPAQIVQDYSYSHFSAQPNGMHVAGNGFAPVGMVGVTARSMTRAGCNNDSYTVFAPSQSVAPLMQAGYSLPSEYQHSPAVYLSPQLVPNPPLTVMQNGQMNYYDCAGSKAMQARASGNMGYYTPLYNGGPTPLPMSTPSQTQVTYGFTASRNCNFECSNATPGLNTFHVRMPDSCEICSYSRSSQQIIARSQGTEFPMNRQ